MYDVKYNVSVVHCKSPPPTVPSGHFCSFWEKEAELVNSIGHFADCDCPVELGSASNLSYVELSKSEKKLKNM